MLDVTKLNLPRKKAQVLSIAAELFQKHGIKRITIEEICQSARVSKMTFYKYFRNKNDLVRYLWQNAYDQSLQQFDDIRAMEIPFENKLQLFLKMKEEISAKISYQFALDYFYSSPELKSFFEDLFNLGVSRFLDFIKESQIKGEVRADIHPEFLLAVLNNVKQIVKDESLVNNYASYKDFVLEINNFIFYGISPRPEKEGA